MAKLKREAKKRISRLNHVTLIIVVLGVLALLISSTGTALPFGILKGAGLLFIIASVCYWIIMRSVYAVGMK